MTEVVDAILRLVCLAVGLGLVVLGSAVAFFDYFVNPRAIAVASLMGFGISLMLTSRKPS